MFFIDTINGYDIYEASKAFCLKWGYAYPCYLAYPDRARPEANHEECSMDNLNELMDWCENN